MSTTVQIRLTPEAQRIAAGLKTMPVRMLTAIARGLDQANFLAVRNIQAKHLTGVGPFPVAEHRLGVRSTRLLGSVVPAPAVVTGQTVTSGIGSNVEYAAIHEFGGVIHRKPRAVTVRLKTDAHGNLVRQAGTAHLAIFARKDNKRVREVKATVGAHDINIPARAPFMTGIKEMKPTYAKEISAALLAAWKQN